MTNIVSEITDELIADAKAGLAEIGDFIKGEGQKIIVVAANTNFGTTVLNLISLESSKTATGAEKMAGVVQAGLSLGEQFLAGGGWTGIFASAEHFVQGVAQLVFTDFAAEMAKIAGHPAA